MSGATVGFFGKLPSHGDFIERRVGSAFRDLWDDWMQHCIVESQQELGGRWLDCYLTSPIWRFYLCDGIAGTASYAGILLPSVDRVGRYFPLTVVVELPIGIPAAEFAQVSAGWFEEIENLCADALQNPEFDLGAFDAALVASGDKLTGVDSLSAAHIFPGNSSQWHWPTASVNDFSAKLSAPLMGMAQSALRPMSMWWTDGSELIEPCVLLSRSLPRPDSFAALLAGTWDDGRWDGELTLTAPQATEPLELAIQYNIESSAASDTGPVREENQDNFLLDDDKRLWAVADGMGGHSHGEIASQMVVDSLRALEPTASLNTAFQAITIALDRVNADLRRGAVGLGGGLGGSSGGGLGGVVGGVVGGGLGGSSGGGSGGSLSGVVVGGLGGGLGGGAGGGAGSGAASSASSGAGSGSTVVVLAIRGSEWGVSWAGDSRAYIWRAGSLLQVTQDHAANAGVAAAGPAVAPGEITRAVGGHDELELEHVADLVAVGDRFLLCSDGLHTTLDEAALIECLQKSSVLEASQALIDAARTAGARDNITAVVVDVKA